MTHLGCVVGLLKMTHRGILVMRFWTRALALRIRLGGGLFGTIEEVRDAIKRQKVKTPWLVPCYGGVPPPGWKIRRLTTNEVERLGLSEYTVWGQQ
jgi:hypothetical protein